jgi:hypothetical protein
LSIGWDFNGVDKHLTSQSNVKHLNHYCKAVVDKNEIVAPRNYDMTIKYVKILKIA